MPIGCSSANLFSSSLLKISIRSFKGCNLNSLAFTAWIRRLNVSPIVGKGPIGQGVDECLPRAS